MVRKRFSTRLLALIAVATLPAASVFAAEAEIPQTVPTAEPTVVQWVDNSGNPVITPSTDVIVNKEQGNEGETDVITPEPTDGDGLTPTEGNEVVPTTTPVAETPVIQEEPAPVTEPVAEEPVVIEPVETPLAEEPVPAEEPVVEPTEPVTDELIMAEEPVTATATLTIVQRLHVCDEVSEFTESVEGLIVGDEFNPLEYAVKDDNIELVTDIETIVLQDNNEIVLEYNYVYGK